MMNSTTNDDLFGDNPFRSNADVFFDSNPAPPQNQPVQQSQQQPQQQQQQQQQQYLYPPPQHSFQPQPATSSFPPSSGPMDTMAPQQEAGQPQMQPPAPRSYWGSCMACLTLDSYRAYFDIDADDIILRMKSVFMDFYKPEHFRNNVLGATTSDGMKGPDLYGPFWITMTLIFFIGVTSNMHDYLHYDEDVDEEFDYDINHLLHAGWILCTFTFGLPFVLWVTTQCMNVQAILLVDWVCLYGYSLTPFLPAVLLSVIPFSIISWICLLLATLVSCSLIVRNVAAPLLSSDVGQAKAPPLILGILGAHFIFFVMIKYGFFHHKARR